MYYEDPYRESLLVCTTSYQIAFVFSFYGRQDDFLIALVYLGNSRRGMEVTSREVVGPIVICKEKIRYLKTSGRRKSSSSRSSTKRWKLWSYRFVIADSVVPSS